MNLIIKSLKMNWMNNRSYNNNKALRAKQGIFIQVMINKILLKVLKWTKVIIFFINIIFFLRISAFEKQLIRYKISSSQ